MPRPRGLHIDVDDLVKRYLANESSVSIARSYGCKGTTITYYLRKAGIPIRTMAEGQRLRVARQGIDHWSRIGQLGKGRPKSMDMLAKRAITNERNRWAETDTDRAFGALLAERGVSFVPQRAIGRYNPDFAIGDTVAVEIVLGGTGRFRSKLCSLRKKVPYLLDRGWDVIVVVTTLRQRSMERAAEYVVAHAQAAGRNLQTGAGHYWVIWGTGEVIASRGTQCDDIALVGAHGGTRRG